MIEWCYVAWLVMLRFGVGVAMTPLFSAFGVPMLTRLVFVLIMSGMAASQALAQNTPVYVATDLSELLGHMGTELAIGLLLSVGVHAAFGAFAVAGGMADMQMGFSLNAALDPVSKAHAAVMGRGMSALAVVLFFVTDMHLVLVDGFFQTLQLMPVTHGITVQGWWPVVSGLGQMFALGFLMATPVVVALWLADVVVAVVSRNMPQMNVLFLSIPLKVLLGLSVLSVSMRFMTTVATQALELPMFLLNKVQ